MRTSTNLSVLQQQQTNIAKYYYKIINIIAVNIN